VEQSDRRVRWNLNLVHATGIDMGCTVYYMDMSRPSTPLFISVSFGRPRARLNIRTAAHSEDWNYLPGGVFTAECEGAS
jgi:hypothetical protein